MKKLILLLAILSTYVNSYALDKINDLVIILNPNVSPGETSNDDDLSIIFFDSQGRKVTVSYTYDPVTNTITITTPGNYFVVITDKKTGKSRTIHIGTFANS